MAKYISRKAIERQRKRFWKKVILTLFSLVLLLFLTSWGAGLKKINIQNIEVVGNFVLKESDILKIINEDISGKYFWLYSKSDILIYPKSKIEKDLLKSFSQIKDLKIKFKDFRSLRIEIAERKPSALWCDDLAGEHCYFIDESAYLYDEAPIFSNNTYFKYFGGISGISTSTPIQQVLRRTYLGEKGKEHFEEVNLFIRLLKDINIDGYKLVVKDNNDYELFFNNNSRLIFDGKQNLEEIFEDFQAVLIDLGDLKGREFEYIDLRFDNKVVYKFKD